MKLNNAITEIKLVVRKIAFLIEVTLVQEKWGKNQYAKLFVEMVLKVNLNYAIMEKRQDVQLIVFQI